MPQMSPMFWVVFPFVLMSLMVVVTMLMEFDSLVSSIDVECNVGKIGIKW